MLQIDTMDISRRFSIALLIGTLFIISKQDCVVRCDSLVKLEDIPYYPGMYFVPQYWFSLSSESWNVLYNVPLQTLDDRIELIDKVWEQLRISRMNRMWIYLNDPRFDLLTHSLASVHGKYKQMKELLVYKDRSKRGIFDSLGSGLKFITGNMDADDEQYYNEKINTIAMDNKRVYQLEKDQLTVIQSTLWAVNKTTLEMQENQELLTKSYQYLEKVTKYNKDKIQNLTLLYKQQEEIIQEMSLLQDLLRETESVLHTLYDAVDNARQGKLTSYLITPKDLYSILINVRSHLHIGDSLPIAVTHDNVYRYYDIMKISAYFSHNSLRYVLNIPLHHIARNYHLFKVIQVPERRKSIEAEPIAEMYVLPEKTVEYIAFSENLQYYAIPDAKQIQECTKPPHIICSSIHIIFPVNQGTNSKCEVDIFRNISNPHCNFRLTKLTNPVWENIPNSNVWIFAAVPEDEIITITCKNNNGIMAHVKDLRIKSKGKLTLEPDCTAIGSSFTLLARHVQKTEMFKFNGLDLVIPNVNLTLSNKDLETLSSYDNFSKQHKELVMTHVTHQLNDLNTASIRISKLKEIMDKYEPTNFESESLTSSYVYDIIIITLLIVLLILYILVKCKLFRKFRNQDNSNVILALGDISSRHDTPSQEDNQTTSEPQSTRSPAQAARRSLRLLRRN